MVPSSGSATPHRNTKMLTQKLQATVRFSRYSLPSVSLFPFLLVSPLILSLPRSSAPTNSTLPPHSCSHCCCCAELTDLFKAAKDAFQLKMHFRGVFPPLHSWCSLVSPFTYQLFSLFSSITQLLPSC